MRIDHVAIAVNNLDEAVKNYQKVLNADKVEVEVVENEKVRVAMINLEDSRIELMEPTEESSTISKYLKDHGEGIHHIAITADNIEQDLSRASAKGMKILGQIRKGSYGRKITFIHPKSLNGVLVELCEAPPDRVLGPKHDSSVS
ncbi:MAG: methylmalonyl-CoA epimerase [Nitrososphaeraceae archaeon]|jgi:methylmalonyl-CoA/ethylmalonyl-CoA epimerase|nr:methylmalonyl-CoA epimerase [Nitrososphaeraceae archaeon]